MQHRVTYSNYHKSAVADSHRRVSAHGHLLSRHEHQDEGSIGTYKHDAIQRLNVPSYRPQWIVE